MLYAVLDTNVLVSAVLASGKEKPSPPWEVLELVFAGSVIPVYNEEILQEYREVLHRRKFKFDGKVVDKLVSEIKRIGSRREPSASIIPLPIISPWIQENASTTFTSRRQSQESELF